MGDCVDEQSTCHYRGRFFGFGPVQDPESVKFAVFDTTPVDGSRVVNDTFDNASLAKSNQSLARSAFVTLTEFHKRIVAPSASSKGKLVGVTTAVTGKLRALRAEIKTNTGTTKVQAVCVYDRVENDDCEGHATIGYAKAIDEQGMSPTQKGKVRARIRLDIAEEFSEVKKEDEWEWPSYWAVAKERWKSIVRACFQRWR